MALGSGIGSNGGVPQQGVELGYAQITSNVTTASVSLVDVSGLSISVVTNGRPFMVKFHGLVQNSAAAHFTQIEIVRTTDSTNLIGEFGGVGAANEEWPVTTEIRQALAAGTYAYKVQFASDNATNTAKIAATAGAPAFLQAIQV